jgi:hypothetical protein
VQERRSRDARSQLSLTQIIFPPPRSLYAATPDNVFIVRYLTGRLSLTLDKSRLLIYIARAEEIHAPGQR